MDTAEHLAVYCAGFAAFTPGRYIVIFWKIAYYTIMSLAYPILCLTGTK
jgi:hypothetical protein